MSRILIVGATGAIGSFITEAILAAQPAFAAVSIFTSSATATNKADLLQKQWGLTSANVITGDITNAADIRRALDTTKPDTLVSALGRNAIQAQQQWLQIADEPGSSVQWVFPSEYGTDIEHNAKSPQEKPHQHKLALRAFIREHVHRLKVTYLVTGPYFDMWVNAVPTVEKAGGFDVAKKHAYLIDEGVGRIGFTTMPDVGKFLVAALRHPSAAQGKALKVQSFVVTPQQVLAEYEKQTASKWTTSSIPLAEIEQLETKLWSENNPRATVATLRRIWAEGGTLYAKNDNDVIGVGADDTDSLAIAVGRALKK